MEGQPSADVAGDTEASGTGLPWRSAAFYVIVATSLVVPLDIPFVSPALPVVAQHFSVTDAQASLLLSAYAAPGILSTPVFGVVADRYGRRSVLVPGLLLFGVFGVAIGFGSQKLVQDIITGVFILLGDMMSVGDVVKLGDRAGLVEAISIRNVRLRDLSGTVHTIPFSSISSVSNLTKDFSYYVFDIGVAYREDVDQVMDVLKEIGDQLQQDPNVGPLILAPLEVLGVDSFGDSAVVVKARIKTVPIQQWTVGRAFNRRIKQRFDELGIEIPFPHRTIYFGQDKQDQAPPARVQLNSGIAVHSPPVGQLDNGEPPPSGTPTPEGSGA